MIELGLGAQEIFAAGGVGTVAAVFSKAAYVRLPGGLVALTTMAAPPGPIHARGDIPIHRLGPGDRVTVDRTSVRAGGVAIDLAFAAVWRSPVVTPDMLAAGAGTALAILGGAPPTALTAAPYAARMAQARAALDRGELAGAVDALAGLGPGLTPAGDDALAGILLVLGAHDRAAAVVAADRARTNDIARAFLAWAARGQSIEPVHRLLAAAAREDADAAAEALTALLHFGHSSGADLAFGLRTGLYVMIATKA